MRLRPDTQSTTVGALWGGLHLARVLGVVPRFPAAVAENLGLLQRADRGLGARHRAVATLRDTWRGLEAARLLDELSERS